MTGVDATAQGGGASGNTSLRLIGEGADSISGGIPTVGIRLRTAEELTFYGSNVLAFDPILLFCCANATYLRVISPGVAIGARLILPVGVRNFDGGNDIVAGAGAEVRFHTSDRAPAGFYLRFSSTLYMGEYEVDIYDEGLSRSFSVLSFVGDIGWRWKVGRRSSFGLMVGIEKFSGGVDSLLQSVPFVAGKSNPVKVVDPHVALRVGHSW